MKVQQKIEDEISFAEVGGVIWDLDNTLYRLDEALEKTFNLAIARSAIALGVDMTLEEACEAARQSYIDFGFSGKVFTEKFGVDYEKMHFHFHTYLDETVVEKSLETKKLFDELNLGHVLITHSAWDWAYRVLGHLELLPYFPEDHILPFEKYNYERKSVSRLPFEMAVERLALPTENLIMVEDLAENLRIPHEMGITTVLLSHGRVPESLPDFVQYCCSNSIELLEKIKADKAS